MTSDIDPFTLLAHVQIRLPERSNPISPPIYQTSTFETPDADAFLAMATEPLHAGFYTRYGNPTTRAFEDAVAALEGTESALATASGMGAVVAALLTFVAAGEHVIAQRVMYGGTMGLLKTIAPRLGIDVSFGDQTATEAFANAMLPRLDAICSYLDAYPLAALPADARRLYDMLLCVAEVSPSTEGYHAPRVPYGYDSRRFQAQEDFPLRPQF